MWYGVRSTGIYCRPTCPARRPQREQVSFFTSCEEAEAAGFRACRRCHPRDSISADLKVDLVQRACQLIDASSEGGLSLDQLSQALHLSPSYFHRMFKSVTGLTPRQYGTGKKVARFKAQVKSGQDITSALYEAGYSSSSRLYEKASTQLGMTPAAYRRGGKGIEIFYSTYDSPLGCMLVAATQQGICAVSFGEQDAELEHFLAVEYPAATLQRDDSFLEIWRNALLEYLNGKRWRLDLPLDVQATAFQLRVWEELRKIPYGETRTYAEVAQAIGQPQAVRAVANACAANPVVLVTPCHRVVRSDGTQGGYRWGMERKQKLLSTEHEQHSP
jgi:AraC family transcriptional regulator, regulatory protein of adaptative response / methylated-DNA-[protein]-cysteine methyltransferase